MPPFAWQQVCSLDARGWPTHVLPVLLACTSCLLVLAVFDAACLHGVQYCNTASPCWLLLLRALFGGSFL